MNKSARLFCFADKSISRNSLYRFRRPICSDVGENLRAVGKKFAEHHRHAVKRIVFGSKHERLSLSVPIKRRIKHTFREITVRIEVRPLSLPLKTAAKSVM